MVPTQGQKSVLEELHETHLGAGKMKVLAQSHVWWPKMDADIEEVARKYPNCHQKSTAPAKAPLHPWEWPAQPCMEQTSFRFCWSLSWENVSSAS